MRGFGVDTFKLVSANGMSFHQVRRDHELAVHSLMWVKLKVSSQDPDFHMGELEEAIVICAYPEWELGIQVESRSNLIYSSIMNCTTKLGLQQIGPAQITMNSTSTFLTRPLRTVQKTLSPLSTPGNRPWIIVWTNSLLRQQVTFCTSRAVPSIGLSNDPLLQGRNFNYLNT